MAVKNYGTKLPLGNEAEMGCWHEWFNSQAEAIRLTPLLYQQLKEYKIIGKIQYFLMQLTISEFEAFVRAYILTDDHLNQ